MWAVAMRMHSRVRPINILASPVRVRRTRAGTVLFAERVDTLYSTVVGEGRFTVNVFFIVMPDPSRIGKASSVKSMGENCDIN